MSLTLSMLLFLAGDPPTSNCPDQIAVQVKVEVTTHVLQNCGSGLNLHHGGVQVGTANNQCPAFALIRPEHAESKPSSNSSTYTVIEAQLPVKRLDFRCVGHWLLPFIPIEVRSSCELQGETTAGSVGHYAQRNCPVRVTT